MRVLIQGAFIGLALWCAMELALTVNLWADRVVSNGSLGVASWILTPVRFIVILVAAFVIFVPIRLAQRGAFLSGLLASVFGYFAALHTALEPGNAVHGFLAYYAVFVQPVACASYGFQQRLKMSEVSGAVVDTFVDHYTDPPPSL